MSPETIVIQFANSVLIILEMSGYDVYLSLEVDPCPANDVPIGRVGSRSGLIGGLDGFSSRGRWENLDRPNANCSAGTALYPLQESCLEVW